MSVRLQAISSYDPFGNNRIENPQHRARRHRRQPVDVLGDRALLRHATLGKPGVGIVLAAAAPVQVRDADDRLDDARLPGVIQAGRTSSGPFAADSQLADGRSRATTFHLTGATARYYLIWITEPRRP